MGSSLNKGPFSGLQNHAVPTKGTLKGTRIQRTKKRYSDHIGALDSN